MTVFMLRSYCEQKELYKTVTVPSNQNGKPRIVVFDAPGALKSFLRPGKRGLLYDFHQQQQKVHNMVRAFKQQGYELVVFLDCNIPDDKLTTWYRRRAVEASTLRKLNQQLSAEPAKNVPDALWLPPNGGLQMLGDAFAKAGCKVFYSFDDSDKEASYWAKVNGAYAIITDDTDFLCYEGVERIWSGQLKLPGGRNSQIRVSELLRQRLLDSLGLNQVQLQQLAGLLGNDHIKHIARDKILQLKEEHPNEHVCLVLARQVLQLQPALGFPAVPVPPASQAAAESSVIDPAVKQAVAAAITAIGGKPAEEAGEECSASEEQPAAAIEVPEEEKTGDTAEEADTSAEATDQVAEAADEGDKDEEHSNEDTEIKGDDEHADEDEEAAADTEPAPEEPATSNGDAAVSANSTTSLVDRCKRAMAQYGCTNVQTPVTVGSGDRWLLLNKGILMRGVAVEDMSRTPCHVLLQPLRLAVYASLGLSSVTEYLCVPDEKWKEWAAGRVVQVPALPPLQARDKRDNRRRKAGTADIDPVVQQVVAAAISNVVAASEGGAVAPAANSEPVADTPATAEPGAEQPAVADIDPTVKKLVAIMFANVIATAARAYEPLPKNLPTKPYELVSFICKRLRALDPSGEQFSRRHEKLLLLQLTHRQGVLAAARVARLRTNTVRLPDLHAANLFLQAYCALQIVQDGKLPKIANLFNVEAFHALCQHKELVKKVEEGPRDLEAGRDAHRALAGSSRQGQHAGPVGGRGSGPKSRGMAAPMVNRPPGAGLMQAGRLFKAGFGMQQPGRGVPQHEGGRGRRAEFQHQGGRAGHAAPYPHQQQQPGYVAAAGTGPVRGRGVREGYQPYPVGGISGVRQQRGEQLTWQQRQQQGSARGGHGGPVQQQAGYQQHGGYQQQQQQQAAGAYQGYDQYGYQQYGGNYQGYGGYQQYAAYQQPYGGQGSNYAGQQAYGQGGSGRGASGYDSGYGAGSAAGGYQGHAVYQQQGYQQYQGQYGGGRGGNRQQHQANGGDAMTWQQQQILGRRPGRGGRDGGGGAAAGGY